MAGETKWTPEQLDAIKERNCSLLVAAAAGAGKTAVLVERIIRRITDPKKPLDIDKLLVVTFTNAAAAEMRERIAGTISAALTEDPYSRNIQRQLTLLNKASITTLHSFFLEVIRNNFHLVDIDPGFRIADETEAVLMQIEVLNELFEEQYEIEEGNQDFFELLECYGGNRDDQALQDMVLNLYSFVQSIPWPEKWLEEMTESFNLKQGADFGDTPWGQVLLKSVSIELGGLYEMLNQAVELMAGEPGLEGHRDVFMEDLRGLKTLLQTLEGKGTKWDVVYSAIQNVTFRRLPPAGKDADTDKKDRCKQIRDDVKKGIGKLQERVFTGDSAEIQKDLRVVYPVIKALARLTTEFSFRYAARKRQNSVLDFNDLEHFCLEILAERDENGDVRPSPTALAYREKYEEILVDEYQDSNLVQELMIKLISREDSGQPNVFMVGDVKQSIYRFRQARPELFLEKYVEYSMEKDSPLRKILLFRNFRSRKEIVDAVNFIFKQIMSLYVGELDYSDIEALNYGANYSEPCREGALTGGETELHLIQTGDDRGDIFSGNQESGEGQNQESGEGLEEPDGNLELEDMPDNVQCEARLAARRIQQLMEPDGEGRRFCVFDKDLKQYRELQYRDIVILLRTTKNWSEVFMEELRQLGIPAFADTGSGFFKTSEVQVILSLLQVIDNPLQDIPLLAVLRSPIVGFTTDELAELRLADRKADIYHALCTLARGDDSREKDSGARSPTSPDKTEDEESGLPEGETPFGDHLSVGDSELSNDSMCQCGNKVGQRDSVSQASMKAAAFLEKLEKWRDMSLYMSTDQLLWQLYNETGYFAMVGAMPAGEQRQANLRILFERARQFEETSYKGLFNFIYFIDKLKSSRGDMGSAKILGENENVVRIMSIHKAKGLEFPVVFLCGCGKQFNIQDTYKSILLHQELGFGPDVVHHRRRLAYPSIPKQAIREKIYTENLSEEMRILYVAMTRAREKLIITGAVGDTTKTVSKWARCANVQGEKLSVYDVHKGRCFLDWIGPALLRHKGCEDLRSWAPGEGIIETVKDSSVWNIVLWDKTQVLSSGSPEGAAAGENLIWPEEPGSDMTPLTQEIKRRLDWEYEYAKASQVPAKMSVTELKHRFEDQLRQETIEAVQIEKSTSIAGPLPQLVRKPLFLQEQKSLSGAEAGTALHFVMQHLDFDKGDLEGQLEAMVEKDLLTRQQADSVDITKISRFLESPLGNRLMAAERVNREVPFQMELPCYELFEDMKDEIFSGETVLLQGVIDCYFEEEDGIVLLDYKTDRFPEGGTEVIRDRYKTQIAYYARALELLTGKKVKDKYIYLFSTGEVLKY